MCCCRPRILWPDPALSCAAVRRTRVVPGPSSASRREAGSSPRAGSERSFGPARTHPGACRCGEGRPALPPASRRGSAPQEPPGALLLAFRAGSAPQGSSQPCVRARQGKRFQPALSERVRAPAVLLPSRERVCGRFCLRSRARSWQLSPAIALPGCAGAGASLSFPLFHPPSSCKKLSVLRPGCQMLRLPTQPSLETC